VSDPEWYNYGSTYPDGEGGYVEVNMPQPFFHSRSIQTSISIYNGATVVMGGLISETRTTVEDKIPLLGDIPLLGRLFQSRMEDSQKRNLLIFVTARLVDPSGRPVKQTQGTLGGGLPDMISSAIAEPGS
jgi:type II secretory pathway component GspD/PulD (secretin)